MKPQKSTRRNFLAQLGALSGLSFVPKIVAASSSHLLSTSQHADDPNELICRGKFNLATQRSLADKSMSEVMIAIGTSFIGTPYVPNVLDKSGGENLVVNLQALDCVTFVENTLSLSRCVKLGRTTFDDYTKQLTLIRYRNGTINGYPSRLHYFTDWIYNNTHKKIVRDVTEDLGGVPYEKKIDFMSKHPGSYRQLSRPQYLEAIKKTELALNKRKLFYIAKQNIPAAIDRLMDGDILAITSAIEGLDVSHTGIVFRDSHGIVRLLHAPQNDRRVEITEYTLMEYLMNNRKSTGIIIARPLDPERE